MPETRIFPIPARLNLIISAAQITALLTLLRLSAAVTVGTVRSAGNRVRRRRSILATHRGTSGPIRSNRQIAVLLVQEGVKPLVVSRR